MPRLERMRHIPAAMVVFPASDDVPRIASVCNERGICGEDEFCELSDDDSIVKLDQNGKDVSRKKRITNK